MLENINGVLFEDGKKLVIGHNKVIRRVEHEGCEKAGDVPASPEALFAKLGPACPKIKGWEPPPPPPESA